MKARWLPVGLVALALFVVNVIARVVTVKGGYVTETEQLTIAAIAVGVVAVLLVGATVWWALRHPLSRLLADLGAATAVTTTLSVTLGPLIAGSSPFAGGLGLFVGQVLLFLGIAAVGVLIGFLGAVASGQDWRSQRLRRYEQAYRAKPHRTVKG